jgi:23S rRNA pseudouridine1911/1915/1917 synthase
MNLPVVTHFEVLDESPDWLVVNKSAPLIVHPTNLQAEPTLLGGVEQLLAYDIANGACPAVVNRLDRDTSGIVLFAKHTAAARMLGILFERRETQKDYIAIVHGWPEADDWECAEPILRAGEYAPSPIWVRQIVHPLGKECFTRFSVEKRFDRENQRYAVVRCYPETGRMHQIRVHLAHSGHAILGDKIYAGDGSEYLEWVRDGWTPSLERQLLLPRHALHAASLGLSWEGNWVEWHAELARDMKDFIEGSPLQPLPDVVIWNRHD